MENSEPKERPHLFSLNASLMMFSFFVGSLSGGFLPLFWAGVLAVPAVDPSAARWALVIALPLTFIALMPLAVIREKPVDLVESFSDLFTLQNVIHYGVIFKLTLCNFLFGIGFGMTTRFFNLFFNMAHDATDEQVGFFLAIGALGAAVTVLLSPSITRRWGMSMGITLSSIASIPFLLFMAAFSNLPLVVFFFVIRGAIYTITMPLRNQLSMMFVVSRERATTAGITHMAFDLGGGAGAFLAGAMIVGGEFLGVFSLASALIAVPALLYYVFFAKMEDARRATASTQL
jgi:MFS family permease